MYFFRFVFPATLVIQPSSSWKLSKLTLTGFLTNLISLNTKRIGNLWRPSTKWRGVELVITEFMEDPVVREGCQVKSCRVNILVRSVKKISRDCIRSIQ